MPPSDPTAFSGWEPPSPEELQRAIPKYEVTAILGRGGMGAVYKGRQAKLDREVAIKLLPETLTQSENELNFAARFVQEARAMAKLDHPAIISVYDFGETPAGQLYFVMEFVDGMDIHQYLQLHGGNIPQEHALSIVAHVLDALDYAHRNGIVHRDIKPANVLLNRDGRVKIADFGLAKRFGEHADPDAPALTMTNMAVGTPDYVAPEAFSDERTPDHRADLYAVGVMLYRMLVGKLPRGNFKAPSELREDLDPRLDRVIAFAMEPDPDDRYASAAAVRADLDEILSRPLPKVEEGAESRVVEPVVPVTSTVKAGRPPRSRIAPRSVVRERGGKRETKKGSPLAKVVLLAGFLGLAAAAWWQLGRIDEETQVFVENTIVVPPPTSGGSGEASKATKEMPFVNSLGMKFVPVPGTNVFFCIHETRYMDYAAYAAENPGNDGPWQAQIHSGFAVTDRPQEHPVWNLTWDQANAFCDWLSAKEDVTYRLPTDREWSFAAGIGNLEDWSETTSPSQRSLIEGPFPWGPEWPPPSLSGNYSDTSRLEKANTPNSNQSFIENYEDGFPTTAPVMSFVPNKLGIYDMDGNLMEWCADRPGNRDAHRRILRGASWAESEKPRLRLTHRNSHPPEKSFSAIGFRVVVEVPKEAPSKGASISTLDAKAPSHDAVASAASDSRTALEPAQATKETPFTNTLGMKFVPVPGTEVLFCIHEVRWRDYAEFAKENPRINGSWRHQTFEGFEIKDRPEEYPVATVSWDEAQAFCVWLSSKEGKPYRIPTDREWSLAVGIGREEVWKSDTTPETVAKSTDHFPWGKQWPPPQGTGNFRDESGVEAQVFASNEGALMSYNDGFPTTAPAMTFEPNEFGIYDLSGNVWEWCDDWWNQTKEERVSRGGSWFNGQSAVLLSSARQRNAPSSRHTSRGFRIVLDVPKDSTPPTTASPPPPAATAAVPVASPKESDLTQATKEAPFTNTLGMKFVPVPGTEVLFCIHETRYRDYEAYAAESNAGGWWRDQTVGGYAITERAGDHPVMRTSWEDAQTFCAWLSQRESRTYRLPTDEEWSLAVGLGGKEIRSPGDTPESLNSRVLGEYPWGTEWPPPSGAGNYSDQSRKIKAPDNSPNVKAHYLDDYNDGFPTTAPAMSFRPNRFGLYDMGGNAWEWVEDWFNEEKTDRVVRGGSCTDLGEDPGKSLLSSFRFGLPPDAHYTGRGFRVVLVPNPAATPAAETVAASSSPPSAPAATVPATKETPFTNTLGMKFVPVPGTGALLCIHETRWKDYAEYAKANPGLEASWRKRAFGTIEPTERPDDHPVVYVSWEDANGFCAWLSKREGKTYRLPKDREWSAAVGIAHLETWSEGTTPESVTKPGDVFVWGSEWPPPEGIGNFSDRSRELADPNPRNRYIANFDDGYPMTAPVMSFAPNPLGIFDLGGNVLEWCDDWWNEEQNQRVCRRSGWASYSTGHLNASARVPLESTARTNAIGFRIALQVETEASQIESTSPAPPDLAVLSSIAGLTSRLEAYFTARNSRLGTLAASYRNAVETRRSQLPAGTSAAEAEAFATELAGIDRLLALLKVPPENPVEVVQSPVPGLVDLPEDSPGTLETLRQTWTSESGKILDSLGEALRQSMKVLESELVKARELDKARAVVEFRDSLPEISNTPFSSSPESADKEDSKVPQGERTIPEGAVEFEGHHYFIFKVPPRNWNEARAHCQSLGGTLAIIDNAKELEFLAELKRNILGERSWAWLGGHMPEDDDTWYWLDGKRMSSRDPWDPKSEFSDPQPTEKFLVFSHLDAFSGHGAESAFVTGFICEWSDAKRPKIDN